MELIDIGRYFAALLMVLALVGFAGLAVRRFGMPGFVKPQGERRLAVVETLMIGPRQRLYLLRRDGRGGLAGWRTLHLGEVQGL